MSEQNSIVAIHRTPQEVERAKDHRDNTQATEATAHTEAVTAGV
jgi:hypothetical protein